VRIGGSESIDRLPTIADEEARAILVGKQLLKRSVEVKLVRIRILNLIDEKYTEPLAKSGRTQALRSPLA
jgi:hypothetical protein